MFGCHGRKEALCSNGSHKAGRQAHAGEVQLGSVSLYNAGCVQIIGDPVTASWRQASRAWLRRFVFCPPGRLALSPSANDLSVMDILTDNGPSLPNHP